MSEVRRDTKIILSCAVTGGAPFNASHPSFPVTPQEIAEASHEAAQAGAAIVHIHARDSKTKLGVRNPALYREIVERIRDRGTDILINLTGGDGAHFKPDPTNEGRAGPGSDVASVDERMEHIEECKPDIASLDVNTSNQLEGDGEYVYLNTTATLRAMASRFQSARVKPELEIFSAGDIEFAKQLIAEGRIDDPPMVQMVLGVKWQAPADIRGMLWYRDLFPNNAVWGALGIGRDQMPMVAQTAVLGGNIRVGLEDNLYIRKGVFGTNAQLVTNARVIIENMGYELASATEARALLGI